MRNFNRTPGTPGTAAALLLALALASSVTIGYSAAAVPGTQNPVPLVNNPLVPDSAAPGGSDFTLTVNGTGFVSASVVQWNGSGLATTFVSASQLTAIVPAADVAAPSTASVWVTNPSPGGGVSNVVTLSIRTPFSAASFGRSTVQIGRNAGLVIARDLNADGHQDLVTALDLAVSVSLGNGDGTFQPAISYPLAAAPSEMETGDFNGDRIVDLAVASRGGFLSILLGNGDGTFQLPIDIQLSYPESMRPTRCGRLQRGREPRSGDYLWGRGIVRLAG